MEINLTDIVIALIGLIGVCVTAYAGVKRVKLEKKKTAQAMDELTVQRAMMGMSWFVDEWETIIKEIDHLIETSNIDRFLLLEAWNGELSPQWTTAVFQRRQGDQEPVSYVHFELDDDYVSRLQTISRGQVLYFEVDSQPESFIKQVYQAEGVKHAVWCHLAKRQIGTNHLISYCSFATHEDELDPSVVTKCRILAGRLSGMAHAFNPKVTV